MAGPFPTVYNKIRFDSFYNENDMYKPFLSDPIMQSFSNEHFEFKIGNNLVTYLNNETVVLSDYTNASTTTALRAIPKGDIVSADQLPDDVKWGPDTDRGSFSWGPWCGCDVNIERVGCDDVRIWGQCQNLVFADAPGTVTVRFYDSETVPDSWFWDEVDFNVDGSFDITQGAGWYNANGLPAVHIRVWASPNCAPGSTGYDEMWLEFTNGQEVRCDPSEKETVGSFTDGAQMG